MKGRRPHTKEQLLAAGTFEKAKHDRPHLSPELIETLPDPPGNLPKDCWADWYRVCDLLQKSKILTPHDLDAVGRYCVLMDMSRQAQKTLSADGPTIKYTTRHGETHKPHPAFRVLLDASRELRAIGERWGFDPYARQKLHVEPDKGNPDPIGDLVKLMNKS